MLIGVQELILFNKKRVLHVVFRIENHKYLSSDILKEHPWNLCVNKRFPQISLWNGIQMYNNNIIIIIITIKRDSDVF